MLKQGDIAPDFELNSTPDQTVRLGDLKGQRVVLAFYPADWSPVCSDELVVYNEALKLFKKYNAQLLGVSVDSKWCHMAFSEQHHFHFPLLADFQPKGNVAKQYGILDEAAGECERALFVIDEQGVIQWSYLSPTGINPGADGILAALDDLDKKQKS